MLKAKEQQKAAVPDAVTAFNLAGPKPEEALAMEAAKDPSKADEDVKQQDRAFCCC